MVFQKMFEPGRIGKMDLKNRIVLAPMVRNWATEEGAVTDRLISNYVAIAEGGVGMMIVEASYVSHPAGKGFVGELGAWGDKLVPGLKELAQAVHAHDVKIGVQIHHAGRQTIAQFSGTQAVAPSPIPCPIMQMLSPGEVPRELTTEEVRKAADDYAEAARRVKEAGFDFVELHGAHGYLITQFLSPITNQRTDQYGGDFAGRMRFALEVVEKTRAKVGPDFPVTIRLSGSEFLEGGMDLAYTQKVVQELDKAGVDGFHISGEIYASYPQGRMIPPMATPPCPVVEFAAGVKQVTSKPVITVSKIYRPELVEDILLKNHADFVAVGRWFLADPQWPNKVKAGKLEDINFCITCQGCIDRLFAQLDVQCAVNPWCGREKELVVKPAAKAKKVMVVGGGPAGIEAAWVAADRGHQVTLYEKSYQLGGQQLLAVVPPTRQDLNVFTQYQMRQLKKTGVGVVTGKEVTPELVEAEKADAVIIATGSTPLIPDMPGVDGMNVLGARDVLSGRAATRETVIVAGGGLVGCGVAEYLAQKGQKVKIVEMLENVAWDMGLNDMMMLLARLEKLGVEIFTKRKITKITPRGVTVEADGKTEEILGETVVLAMGAVPDRKLAQALEGKKEIYIAGDCVEARKLLEAVYEGAKAGCQV